MKYIGYPPSQVLSLVGTDSTQGNAWVSDLAIADRIDNEVETHLMNLALRPNLINTPSCERSEPTTFVACGLCTLTLENIESLLQFRP